MADCGSKCAKFLLITFNIFIWIAGAAVLGVGIYLRVGNNVEDVINVAELSIYYSGCYLLIIAGSAMFILGFVGCCGAMVENRCILGIYAFSLIVLLIVEVGVGIWAVVNENSIETEVQKAFNKTLTDNNPDDVFVQSVQTMQRQFHCCGLMNGCSDWKGGKSYGCDCDVNATANGTCVLATSLGCTDGGSTQSSYIWKEPCYQSVVDFISQNLWVIIGIGFGIGFAELIGITFAILVCRLAKKNSYESMYA